MESGNELEIIARYYDLLLWSIPEIGKIPRSFRFTLGEKIEVMMYAGLDDLIRATLSRSESPVARKIRAPDPEDSRPLPSFGAANSEKARRILVAPRARTPPPGRFAPGAIRPSPERH